MLRVVVVSDADQRRLQQMHDGRQHFFARQSAKGHMLQDLLADRGQRVGESNDMLVLGAFSDLTEAWVVAVLLAALRVAPCRLNVAIREGAYPDFRPRRRDRERLDAFQDIFFGQFRAVRARIAKTGPGFLAAYAGAPVRNIAKTRGLGGVPRVNDRLDGIG